MSGLKAVARTTLGEQVAAQIAEMISERRWKVGEKLPSETELCGDLHVGRSTLREALKSLAFAGLVRMRAGDGTYVAEPSRGVLDRIFAKGFLKTEKDLADVWETRLVLETELAALAAERATDNDITRLGELITQGEERLTGDRQSFSDLDLDFHLAVANCSQNKLLPRLLMDVRGLLAEWITKSQELPGMRENAQEQHKRIYKSIVRRDPEKARKEMKAHLNTFERAYKLLGRLSDSGPISQPVIPAPSNKAVSRSL
ncbi:MAG: FadR family transcriptional regulator [Acidobacteriaceae bacterium]|nr:FadR family transcriptional regulator [Acidobacteriaceae bacterium]